MPMHFQSITEDDQNREYLGWLLTDGLNNSDSVFVSPDKYIHIQKDIKDSFSGREIGKFVYTMKVDDEQNAVVVKDLDIILKSEKISMLHFLRLLEGSSDANEYYEAEVPDGGGHLEIETVNRHVVPEGIVDTEREVRISAFPFELTVFSDMDALNGHFGLSEEIEVGNSGIKVGGLSDRFIMPGGLFDKKKPKDEHYSFLVGTVESYSDVCWEFGKYRFEFVIAQLRTALGVIPAAMGRDVFDLSKLEPGCVIAMNADIKVDLSKPEDFTITKP